MSAIAPGTLVMLVNRKGKRYIRACVPGETFHTADGMVQMDEVAAAGFGGQVRTQLARPFTIFAPTLYDLLKNIKRSTQVMYPKDIGYVLTRLGAGPGKRIVEAGAGSGGMTTALAWMAGPTGRVYTHERREEFMALTRKNIAWAGMDDGRVELIHHDIEEGFTVTGCDALFLDVREPVPVLPHIAAAVIPGAPVGFLLPTTNQVQELLFGLNNGPFAEVDVLEISLRRYKPVHDRFRPADRMVAHTAFLIFARVCTPACAEAEESLQATETTE